jgi:hypothetical protein
MMFWNTKIIFETLFKELVRLKQYLLDAPNVILSTIPLAGPLSHERLAQVIVDKIKIKYLVMRIPTIETSYTGIGGF